MEKQGTRKGTARRGGAGQGTARKAPEAESRERRIIIDLAQRIEQRGRERFAVKSANIRKRLMEVMESGWPHSSDQTLMRMAIGILTNAEPGEEEIFSEIRELNSDIVPSERPMMPCPYETDAEVEK